MMNTETIARRRPPCRPGRRLGQRVEVSLDVHRRGPTYPRRDDRRPAGLGSGRRAGERGAVVRRRAPAERLRRVDRARAAPPSSPTWRRTCCRTWSTAAGHSRRESPTRCCVRRRPAEVRRGAEGRAVRGEPVRRPGPRVARRPRNTECKGGVTGCRQRSLSCNPEGIEAADIRQQTCTGGSPPRCAKTSATRPWSDRPCFEPRPAAGRPEGPACCTRNSRTWEKSATSIRRPKNIENLDDLDAVAFGVVTEKSPEAVRRGCAWRESNA